MGAVLDKRVIGHLPIYQFSMSGSATDQEFQQLSDDYL